jgi:hypothetical protein
VLTASSGQTTGLAATALQILFVGVILTIGAPVLFRTGTREGTRMAVETFTSVGYGAIVISLGTFLPSVFRTDWVLIICIALAASVVLRELLDSGQEISWTWRLFARPPTIATASANNPT